MLTRLARLTFSAIVVALDSAISEVPVSRTDNDSFSVASRSSASPYARAAAYPAARAQALLGADLSQLSRADKIALLQEILRRKIHGISFSPYLEGQKPGVEIGENQIRQRLEIIQPYTRWIRSFSCIEGNQAIPRIAHELGLKTMVGIDLSEDREANEAQLANGLEAARAGHVDILVVGNENMLRQDLSEDELIAYMERARDALPGLPVSYVDAYFLFENHPRVTAACDPVLINCYPFWESCPAEYALLYIKEMYRRGLRVADGKRVIISETGWPTSGTAFHAAQPSYDNALEYFIRTYQWAEEEGIEIFYFSSFDESWKVGAEGDVGAYWGLWDQDGNLKYT